MLATASRVKISVKKGLLNFCLKILQPDRGHFNNSAQIERGRDCLRSGVGALRVFVIGPGATTLTGEGGRGQSSILSEQTPC